MRSHQNKDSSRPSSPTPIRIQPTASRSTLRFGSSFTANASTAPTAIRIRLTGTPTCGLWPARVEQKLGGDPRIVPAHVSVPRGILLERAELETRARDGRD